MSLNWRDHDEYSLKKVKYRILNQHKHKIQISEIERDVIEQIACKILNIPQSIYCTTWGTCSHFGVYSKTVIKVHLNVTSSIIESIPYKCIGLKIFRPINELTGWIEDIIRFHNEIKPQIPLLQNNHIQKTFKAGYCTSQDNVTYPYLIQEWVEGHTIEHYINNKLFDIKSAIQVLDDLFLNMIIPLWSKGLIWMCAFAANYCISNNRVVMIDTDSLFKTVKEYTSTPNIFTIRNTACNTALEGFQSMFADIAISIITNATTREHFFIKKAVTNIWNTYITQTFKVPCICKLTNKKIIQEYFKFKEAYIKLITGGVHKCIITNLQYEGNSSR